MAEYYGWAPYVPVAERRRKAEKAMEKQRKRGVPVAPVIIQGRTIAHTFWGRSWCENLESYSDFANRLPRGRTYVRNGSVIDLHIAPGLVRAQVSGSSIYQVRVDVKAVSSPQWQALCGDCGGAVASLVELLQGRFNQAVMERLCRQGAGLFPAPKEIAFSCSCPDGAYLCKHVAAVLYGIGSRLDTEPGLLFLLRQVDGNDLLAQAAVGMASAPPALESDRVLEGEDLADLFGLDLSPQTQAASVPAPVDTRVVRVKTSKIPAKPAPNVSGTKKAKRAAAEVAIIAKGDIPEHPQPAKSTPRTRKQEQATAMKPAPKKPGKALTRKKHKAAPKTKSRSGILG